MYSFEYHHSLNYVVTNQADFTGLLWLPFFRLPFFYEFSDAISWKFLLKIFTLSIHPFNIPSIHSTVHYRKLLNHPNQLSQHSSHQFIRSKKHSTTSFTLYKDSPAAPSNILTPFHFQPPCSLHITTTPPVLTPPPLPCTLSLNSSFQSSPTTLLYIQHHTIKARLIALDKLTVDTFPRSFLKPATLAKDDEKVIIEDRRDGHAFWRDYC